MEDKIIIKESKFYDLNKRLFDIIFSFFSIVFLSPLMLIVGLIIRVTSKGPIIYVSERIGQSGKPFKFYKFRSMIENADSKLIDLLKDNEIEGGVIFKMKDDPRITKFGKFIRKTSIDELPQLFNVLKGDMSLVGPRPCTTREFKLYDERTKQRLLVPQGLTGEWQVHGRSNTTFEQMLSLDFQYITNKRSFLYDIRLILETFIIVFKKKGAE